MQENWLKMLKESLKVKNCWDSNHGLGCACSNEQIKIAPPVILTFHILFVKCKALLPDSNKIKNI